MEEVEYALHISSSEKAAGPDGFSSRYVKSFWPQLKDKVMHCF